jgi:hypothetical protein
MTTEGTMQALYAQFKDIQAVASIMTQCALGANSRSYNDLRDEGPSSFAKQYPYGVMIQFSYGKPHWIYTSCGAWRVDEIDGGNYGPALLAHPSLKLEIFKPAVTLGGWTEGPSYYVKELYGDELPQPFQRERLWSPQQCKVLWQTLMGRYAAEQLGSSTPFNAQIKRSPEDRRIYKYREQIVAVPKISPNGVATFVTLQGDIEVANLSDFVLFSSGLIK